MKKCCQIVAAEGLNLSKSSYIRLFRASEIIPTRCRNSNLRQFYLDNIVPDILIILISHIIIAIQWVLIKILSTVINHNRECMELFSVAYIFIISMNI